MLNYHETTKLITFSDIRLVRACAGARLGPCISLDYVPHLDFDFVVCVCQEGAEKNGDALRLAGECASVPDLGSPYGKGDQASSMHEYQGTEAPPPASHEDVERSLLVTPVPSIRRAFPSSDHLGCRKLK